MQWFRQAAASGNADAAEQIGLLYLNGQGVPQDDDQAQTWFLKAAKEGSGDADVELGLLALNGHGGKGDAVQAMDWFRRGAAAGAANGEEQIAFLYLRGQGVKQDDGQAISWFRKAAADGSTDAETQIGLLYLTGAGSALAPSDDAAVQWFMKAGGGSVATVEDHIGLRYLNGQGVSPDYGQAMRWFSMAEQKGSEYAADHIGYLYLSGSIPPNPTAAHQAFEMALALALGTLQGEPNNAVYANDVAWQQLLVGDAKDALVMADQAISDATGADGVLPADKIWLIINKADALMLLGQTDAARKIYLAYRNVQDDGNGNAWRTDVLGDFAKIHAVTGDVPLMDEITADFSSKVSSPNHLSGESVGSRHGGG
jgi:TPR repeat protein